MEGSLSSPRQNNRVVCYCDDCQAFAHFLKREDILDEHGGTDIVQVTQAQVKLPKAELRCMRLSEKGPFRWYTACCKTPAGNTLHKYWSPFAGIAAGLFVPGEGRTLDDVLGPPVDWIWGRFATGTPPPHVHPKVSLGGLGRVLKFVSKGAVRRQHKPSSYFDARTHEPVSTPQVLTAAERAPLYR